jgi:predicted negative regulator of RcsB-dependent stress response
MEGKGGNRLWFLLGIIAVIIILAIFFGGWIVERSRQKEQAAELQKKMQDAAKTLQKQSEEMRKSAEELQRQLPKK